MATPQAILDALGKLDAADKALVTSYITNLQSQLKAGVDHAHAHAHEHAHSEHCMHEEEPEVDIAAEEEESNNEPPFPPLYESGEDFDKAGDLKQEAADFRSASNWEAALEKYTDAILAAPPSSLLYANRATALLELGRPRAAERDCNEALKENPDSAKALRVRGKARKALGQWEAALHDLSASQQIDFDEATVEDLKFLSDKRIEQEKEAAAKRIQEEDRLRKKSADIKKAREEAKKEAEEEARAGAGGMPDFGGMGGGGMPDFGGMGGSMPGGMGGGMPGGMPGAGGGMPAGMEGLMGSLMSDPELVMAMQNPKVMAAFQELMSGPGGPMGLMSNPAKLQEMMSDPEVGPVLQKLMAKMGGGGMGMPGMPGAGAGGGGDDDGIPNLDDMDGDVDLDDLPDLE